MKLDEVNVQSLTSETFKTTAFRVDQKMAQILFRDKLYTEAGRLRVIPQEYMANARDAHRSAGKSDTPIEVTLPTSLSPEFIVRDFGNGISPELVEDIFVVYGASTKKGSDVENGGYGIGAKSAFSYANAFSVTTTVKGVRYIYSACIDADGMNQFMLMDQGPATGPDGTEVRIPVKANDISTFWRWVTELTHTWTPRPVITNDNKLRYTDVQPEFHGAGWEVYAPRISSFNYRMFFQGITVLADDIPYTITQAQADAMGGNVKQLYNFLVEEQRQIVFHFKVGELSIPPQRESIDVTAKSTASLARAVDVFLKAMTDSAKQKVEKLTDPLDRLMMVMRNDFDLHVATTMGLPVEVDSKMLVREIDLERAGIRAVVARFNHVFRDAEEIDTITFRDLLKGRRGDNNSVLIDTSGNKLGVPDIKRFARKKCNLGYGGTMILAVYDTAAFEKEVGIKLERIGEVTDMDFITYTRAAHVGPDQDYDSGYIFVKKMTAEMRPYYKIPETGVSRKREDDLDTGWTYMDFENGRPLIHGAPVTYETAANWLCAIQLLSKGEIGYFTGELRLWEERFTKRLSPNEVSFVEDRLLEAFEELVKKPEIVTKICLAIDRSKVKPAPIFKVGYVRKLDDVISAMKKSELFTDEFLAAAKTVIDRDEEENEYAKEQQKYICDVLLPLIRAEVGDELDKLLDAYVTPRKDVIAELQALAASGPLMHMILCETAAGGSVTIPAGEAYWKDVLPECLKTWYKVQNPHFSKVLNP